MSRLLLALIILSPCWSARITSRDPPRVTIPRQGVLNGREVVVTRTQRAKQYLGIPFAQPPTGDLRFAAPNTSPLPSWESTGERNSSFKPACMQDREKFMEHDRLKLEDKLFPGEPIEFSEDCLYLNVYVPDGGSPTDGWPVMIWFHPGDFSVGAASLWDASVFAVKQQVIVVTTSYRLNVFGFFTTFDGHAPGNFGLLDQVAAIDWVRLQIGEFGGSAEKVVLAGHGAGALSVGLHIVSPLSRGKFSGALQMSGSVVMPMAIKTHMKSLLDDIREIYGCDTSSYRIMSCLRHQRAENMLQQTAKLVVWGPIVDKLYVNKTDESFLPLEPLEILQSGSFNKVPLMVGYTDMEEALAFGDKDTTEKEFDKDSFEVLISDTALDGVPQPDDNSTCYLDKNFVIDSVSFFYNAEGQNTDGTLLKQKYIYYTTDKKYGAGAFNQSAYMSTHNPVYLYRFDYRMKTVGIVELQEWMNVPQFCELPFVWGMPYWTSLSPQIIWNSADKKVADAVMSLWGNFTKFLNPAQHGRNIRWDPFSLETPAVMLLDKIFNMSDSTNFNLKALSFWNEYFPKVVNIATQCCNSTNQSSYLHNFYSPHVYIVFLLTGCCWIIIPYI